MASSSLPIDNTVLPVIQPGARMAHVDEAGVQLPDRSRLYVLAAVLSSNTSRATIVSALRPLLLPGRPYLHHYDETGDRRRLIAEAIANIELHGALVFTLATTTREQERARARLLIDLLPHLQHAEHVDHLIVESRAGSDKLDRKTVARLRRSRHTTGALRVDHVRKDVDPVLWLPDFVAGSWIAARYHDQPEPWDVLASAHCVEVRETP